MSSNPAAIPVTASIQDEQAKQGAAVAQPVVDGIVENTLTVKAGLAQMLKGGVIMGECVCLFLCVYVWVVSCIALCTCLANHTNGHHMSLLVSRGGGCITCLHARRPLGYFITAMTRTLTQCIVA